MGHVFASGVCYHAPQTVFESYQSGELHFVTTTTAVKNKWF